MNSVTPTNPTVNLYADEWPARTVADFARVAARQTVGSRLNSELTARVDVPIVNGARSVNRRHWQVVDTEGNVLVEANSLYQAIHSLAR